MIGTKGILDANMLPKQQRRVDELAESIKRSWQQVKQMEAGKMRPKSALDFADELTNDQ